MQNSLLFNSHTIDNSNLIDHIRQSIIEIKSKIPKTTEIQQIFTKAISYLDKKITDDEAKELFSLIICCFSTNPSQFLPLFGSCLYKYSTKNQYYLIITSYIFYFLTVNSENISIDCYRSFIDDSLNQIVSQIEKNTVILFDHEISPLFKNELIVNLLLCSKLTNELVVGFSPFILTQKIEREDTKIKLLIEKISKTAFCTEIPQNDLSKIATKIDFSIEAMMVYIPILSEQIFRFILPQICESIQKANNLNPNFSIIFLKKCNELNITVEPIEKLVDSINDSDLTQDIVEYLKQYKTSKIEEKIAKKVDDQLNIENVSEEEFNNILLDIKYLSTYLDVFQSIKTNHPIVSSPKLWTHIVTIASKSKREEMTDEMMKRFRLYFQIFVKSDNFDNVLNEMMFSVPQTLNGLTFIFYLVYDEKRETSKKCLTPLKKKKLLKKITDNKIIPPNCFWKLYTKNLIYKEFNENPHPLLLYGYQFANGEFEHEFEQVTILSQNENSKENIYQLIKREKDCEINKFELIDNMNQEAVSLIASALLFTRFEGIIEVNGLTNEIILPFLAVVFDYSNLIFPKESDRNDVLIELLNYFKQNQKFALIKEALKSIQNNDSPLQTVSVDLILPYLYSLLDSNSFSFHVCLAFIEKLFPFLLNDNYQANKMILLSAIFQFSNGEYKFNNSDIPIEISLPLLFKNNEKSLFDFIVKNIIEINEYKNLEKTPLNLSIFEDSVSSLIIDIINDLSSIQDTVLFINFMQKMCKNVPKLMFKNTEKLENILQNAIKEEKSKEASLIYQFMLNNVLNDDFHHLFENPFLLSYLQGDTIQLLQKILFEKFMKEESISFEYLIILLQKIINNNYLRGETILSSYLYEYKTYNSAFIKAIDCLFIFDKNKYRFVMKPELKFTPFSINENDSSFISKLFEVASTEKDSQFNAFNLLKSIVYSFPFLFENNSLRIFNVVLPILKDYSLIFDNNLDKKQEKSAKNAISALSFLISTLCSPKILDEFFIWLFNNIKTFSDSQILAFIVVLRSLMSYDYIRIVLLSQLIKYNFIDLISIIIKRDVPVGQFRNFYLGNIYNLVETFYYSLNHLSSRDKIFVNELINIENPFQLYFDNSKATFPTQQSLQLIVQNESVIKFINEIEEIQPFWFIYNFEKERKTDPTDDQLDSFLLQFEEEEEENENENENKDQIKLRKVPHPLTSSMIHLLITKPSWVIKWIEDSNCCVLLHEHYEFLDKIINELIEIKEKEKDEINNDDDFILIQYQEKSLFEELIKTVDSSMDDYLFKSLSTLLIELSNNETVLLYLMEFIAAQIINKKISMESISNFINILKSFSICNKFLENFVSVCGNVLLDMILTPEFRSQKNLLLGTTELFISCDFGIPNRIIYLIEFMLLFNDSHVIQSAITLSTKLEKSKQELLIPFITNTFDKSTKIENKMIDNISLILNSFPEIVKDRTPQLLTLLNQFLEILKEEDDFQQEKSLDINKEQLLNLIGSIFNVLAPKRSKNQLNDSFSVYENEIPSCISSKSPDFWNVFSKHRKFINQELYKDPLLLNSTFHFLLEYPELVSFDIRLSYFNEIKKKIGNEEKLELTMIRMNILNDSLEKMNQLSLQDFLKMIQIQYVGDKSKIQNGDFYRSLTKELFHPKNYIFIYSENKKSFQINPRSEANKKHLEYFNFAGKIIARALLENESLGIHLTSSLYKNILKLQLELEDLKEIDYKLFMTLQRKLNENLNKSKPKEAENDDDCMVFTLQFDDSEEEEEEEANDDDDDESKKPVNSNQMYVDSKVDYRLKDQIKDQIKAFCDGFYMVIPHDQIKIFFPNELDLLISGMPMIDVNDLKRNVELEYPLNSDSPAVKMFFNAISKWDQEKLAQLVMFITMSAKSIILGFKTLKEVGNPIKIACGGDENDLPQSIPFINLLLLPEYKDEDALNWKFFIAFNESNSKPTVVRKKVRRYK